MLFLMIDLHTHSNASDGQYRPAELVEKACESGISAFALTDHDTIAGLSEAAAEAEKRHITFIRGIEIFVEWPTGEFHLLDSVLRIFRRRWWSSSIFCKQNVRNGICT